MKSARSVAGMVVGCVLLLIANAVLAEDWPQWRGPNRDNKVTGFAAPKTWPKELKQQWKVASGNGESSPVMVGDKIYVFGRVGGDEVTLCLDAATGKEIWKDKYAAVTIKGAAQQHPGPRSTPAVGEGKVCTFGVGGVVSCFDAASGKLVWRKDTKSKLQFYTSSSPIIADGKCIIFATSLTAYDLNTGEPKWEWTGAGTPYGSPILMTTEGVKQVVTPALGLLAGISLADGKRLWDAKIGDGGKDYQSNYATPIIDGQTVIYTHVPLKAKAGTTVALSIEKKGDVFTATEAWNKGFGAHHYHTPVLRDGLLFGVSNTRKYFCMDAKTGKELWKDKSKSGECGSMLNCGSVLMAVSSDSYLVVLEPSDKDYKEVAKYKVSDKVDKEGIWSCPIVTGNRIYVKDKEALTLWTID